MSRAKIVVAFAVVVAVAAAAGISVALHFAHQPPPLSLLTDAECLEGAHNLRLPALNEFFSVDPNDPRFAQRGQEIRADFKRVLAVELTDADLERIHTETLVAWGRRKEQARVLISRYAAKKPTPDLLTKLREDTAELLRKFGEKDFRTAARISKAQYDLLQQDVKRRRAG
jgi:hypothetical protein